MLFRPRRRLVALLCAAGAAPWWAAGCATAVRPASPDVDAWSGRLAVRATPPGREPLSFSAAFELRGTPTEGQLQLRSPLGTTLAHLQWQPGLAVLRTEGAEGREQRHASLDALAQALSGLLMGPADAGMAGSPAPADALPLASLFDWLGERRTAARAQDAAWELDDSRRAEGRLVARRRQPDIELRLILDR